MITAYIILSLLILIPLLLGGWGHIQEGGSADLSADDSWRYFTFVALVSALGLGVLLSRIFL